MATLLVIGGTGFFGKSILDLFQRGGLDAWNVERVIAMSRHAERLRQEAPALLSDRVTLVAGDITTARRLPSADYVIHAAASTDARHYLARPEEERRNIQAGTLNYCELARDCHRDSKIVYVSSGAVYGAQPATLEQVAEDQAAADVQSMPEGKRDYAVAKRDAEAAIVGLGGEGLAVGIARCFAFIGPWLPRDQHFAIGNFIGDALAGRRVTVNARHRVYRSYLHADDMVRWLMAIAAHAGPDCPTYNVGSDQPILMGALAALVAQESGLAADAPETSGEQVDRYVPSIAKIRAELGVEMQYNLTAAIRATLGRLRDAGP